MGAAFTARWEQAVRTAALGLGTESRNGELEGTRKDRPLHPWGRTGPPKAEPCVESAAQTLPELGSPSAIPCPVPGLYRPLR